MMTTIRVAVPTELDRVRAAYRRWSYSASVSPEDLVFVAERNGVLVGIVREAHEHGHVLLRGMQVAPTAQRSGVGTLLLRAFVERLADLECYCVPYRHLINFYASVGFEHVQESLAPDFLRERAGKYRTEGRDVLLMRRPALPPS